MSGTLIGVAVAGAVVAFAALLALYGALGSCSQLESGFGPGASAVVCLVCCRRMLFTRPCYVSFVIQSQQASYASLCSRKRNVLQATAAAAAGAWQRRREGRRMAANGC